MPVRNDDKYRRNLRFLALAMFVLFGVGLWALFGLESLPEPVLLGILAFLCVLPILVGRSRGRFDVFEPVYYVALVTFVYYVLVVIIHIIQDSFVMMGIDYRAQVPLMLGYSALSLLSFYVGYYWPAAAPVEEVVDRSLDEDARRYVHRVSILIFGLLVFLVALWIWIAKMPLRTLFIFGEASYGDWWALAQGPKIGYLYGAREALPAALLLMLGTRGTRRVPLPYVLVIIAVLIFFAGDGGRSRVLLVALSVWVFLHLERKRRPGVIQILVVAALVFYMIIGAVGFYRGSGNVVGQTPFTVDEAWDVFVDSSSVAVASAARLYWVPSETGYYGGRFLLKAGVQWIPGFLWPAKYDLFPDPIFEQYFSRGAATTYWVGWYSNWGPIGIAIGMLLLAWVVRRVYDRYRQRPSDLFAQVTLALLVPFLIKMVGRGDLSQTIYAVLFVFSPVVVAKWLFGAYERRRQEAQEVEQVKEMYLAKRRRREA